MNSFPIETTKEGNRITKVCVEDVSRIFNRIKVVLNKSYSNITSIMRSVYRNYNDVNSNFVIGVGTSQPCIIDVYDEEIGNNIAFMKAKLSANIKKFKLLKKTLKEVERVEDSICDEMEKIYEYIILDLDGIRKHNPDYLKNYEYTL